ncbi:hypothetical protein TREES_T100005525, partial [Tupaia chinensis]
ELRKATAPVHLPLSCYLMPKEEFPPSPEYWRLHPSKPNAVPYCYFNKSEIYSHWHTLYGHQEERDAQKMSQKKRDHPRYLKEGTHGQMIYLPMSKLTIRSQVGSRTLEPTSEALKQQRLKALGCLGVGDKFVMEALRRVAQTGSEKVKYEAYRSLAILGCLNKHVIQALISQLKGQNEGRKMETLTGLRVALNSWAAVSEDKRTPVEDEEKLVSVLQILIKKSSNKIALEAALSLGFLRPCSNMAQEFLLQFLYQQPKTEQMKALRMLVKIMHVYTDTVIRAILDQLYSDVLEDRLEANQMLRTIGLEQIKAHGLEELTFDRLRKKTYNEPFFAMRQAVAKTVEVLKMKPTMINLVEAQLMNPNDTARQEAVTSLSVLGIRNPQVFHLLLDMLDAEENQAVKTSLQETLILRASIDPWIQNKVKNKIFFVCEAPKTNVKIEPTRFRKQPEIPEELNIQDFRLAKLNPLFVAKSSTKVEQKKKLPAFPPCFLKPQKHKPQATGPWEPSIRTLAENSK